MAKKRKIENKSNKSAGGKKNYIALYLTFADAVVVGSGVGVSVVPAGFRSSVL